MRYEKGDKARIIAFPNETMVSGMTEFCGRKVTISKVKPFSGGVGMKYSEMIKQVQNWAKERGLDKTDPHAQGLKIAEEMGEMFQAFLKGHEEDELDAVGDLQVTLIIYCLQRGIDYEKCLSDAYSVIENRKGKTVDGVFIKEADLG